MTLRFEGTMALLLLSVGCGGPGEVPARQEAALAPELPEGAQAISLLGEPLHPPELTDGVRAEREANYQAAMAELAQRPDDADALIWAGRRAAYLGRYDEAIEIYGRGIELHPADARFYRHRGHRWISIRQFDRAIADLGRATELIEGTEDTIEPDGLPNALGIPTSTLHFNVWYHLALAHYLKGEFEQALAAYNACMDASRHPDSVVATAYWLHNTLLRLEMEERANEVLGMIEEQMEIVESTSYLDVLLLHKGLRTADDLRSTEAGSLASVTAAYGIGLWHLSRGRRDQAVDIWGQILTRESQWPAFGFIAAEAEVARNP